MEKVRELKYIVCYTNAGDL